MSVPSLVMNKLRVEGRTGLARGFHRRRLGFAAVAFCAAVFPTLWLGSASAAEAERLTIARQFGIGYLALAVIQERKLIEAAARDGIGEVEVRWVTLNADAINTGLLSGQLDIGSGGIGNLLPIWAQTRGRQNVRGLAALASMPIYLNSIDPKIKTIRDYGANDRIALPAVRSSIQAVVLEMAAEQAFGPGHARDLDKYTVSLSHPDGMIALLSGGTEVKSHFTSAPYMYQELQDKRVHRVLNSYDVLGGPGTFLVAYAGSAFRERRMPLYKAVLEALDRAMALINADPDAAAGLWIANEKSTLSRDFVAGIIRDPENRFTTVPENTKKFADFMSSAGLIREKAETWQDLFFPEAGQGQGS